MCVAALALCLPVARAADLSSRDDAFLNELEFRSAQFFLRESDPVTGLVPDHAPAASNDQRRIDACSVAGGGFGLAALCIADARRWIPHTDAVARVRTALRFAVERAAHERGFLYHFLDRRTGRRHGGSEVSPIDTTLFLCGALTARRYFQDPEIRALATAFYERIDWPWMLDGGETFRLGWWPERGFSRHRWHGYAEHMAMYLLAMGSPTHPIPAECWHAWLREPVGRHDGKTFIMYPPLFVHQYAHAFVDFRGLSDDYADYWQNSVLATRANRAMCIGLRDRFPHYGPELWGITASVAARGYRDWGGPPATPDIDGTVVPCAAGGSLPFAPRECLTTLRAMRERYEERVWCRYGFVDAFNPATGWQARDVLAIDTGITLVMAENLRTERVWDAFMANPEVAVAMQLAGFRPAPRLPAGTSLLDARRRPPAHRDRVRETAVSPAYVPEFQWDWRVIDAANARESVFDGEGLVSARFAFGWDATALHVRVSVTDPAVGRGDKIELYLDPENDGFRWGDYRDFLFNFAATEGCGESLNRPCPPDAAVAVTNDGYQAVASIPWRQLGIEPRPGLVIGCSPGVYSVNRHDEPALKLNWCWIEEDPAIRLGTIILAEPRP